jgi:hypothetical protein
MQESKSLGPTNYTGSNTAKCKSEVVDRVQTSTTKVKSSSASIEAECELDALNKQGLSIAGTKTSK